MMRWVWDSGQTTMVPRKWVYDFDTDTHHNAPVWFKDETAQRKYEEIHEIEIRRATEYRDLVNGEL